MTKADAKMKAYTLYVEKGKTGRAVAAKLDISETNFYRWAKENNWKEQRELAIKEKIAAGHADGIDVNSIINFKEFLQEKRPKLYRQIRESINEYLQLKA